MTIRLPIAPIELDYEDMVIAALIGLGYYVEGRLIFKDGGEEILEFDAIATPTNNYQQRYVVEVKSGKWGNGDIFKLAGQVQYTANKAAWLVHLKPQDTEKAKATRKIAKVLPVECIHITRARLFEEDNGPAFPRAVDRAEKERTITIAAWWSRIADRLALASFRSWSKSNMGGSAAAPVSLAREYNDAMDGSLFEHTPRERAMALYEAYKAAPKLVNAVADIGGNGPQRVSEAWSTSGQLHLQYIMTLQNRARIAIIKNAYDQILLQTNPAIPTRDFGHSEVDNGIADERKRDGIEFKFEDFFPTSFVTGFKKLGEHPYPERVPYFFQTFVEILGGFYYPLNDDDCQLVADVTTMPRDQIAPTLKLLDDFFPFSNGWTSVMRMEDLHFLKAVPAYMRGVGCLIRRNILGEDAPHGTAEWQRALYEILKHGRKELGIPVVEGGTGT